MDEQLTADELTTVARFKGAATEAAERARTADAVLLAYLQVIVEKYDLRAADTFAADGVIVRGPRAESPAAE